jgi:replicative DNA helicase
MNREIPHNLDAEQSVLGAMFLTKKALQKALELLDGSEFYSDNHSKIFECIKNVEAKGSIVDISMVIRVVLTTKSMTPDLYEIMKLLGTTRIKQRINKLIEN